MCHLQTVLVKKWLYLLHPYSLICRLNGRSSGGLREHGAPTWAESESLNHHMEGHSITRNTNNGLWSEQEIDIWYNVMSTWGLSCHSSCYHSKECPTGSPGIGGLKHNSNLPASSRFFQPHFFVLRSEREQDLDSGQTLHLRIKTSSRLEYRLS